MKSIIVFLFVATAFGATAQFSVSAGPSLLKGFGVAPSYGFNLGLELPQDDATSYYGRVSHFFNRNTGDSIFYNATAISPTTQPTNLTVMGINRVNFTTIEGGIRYYIGEGFDYGWAGYGGTKLSLMFSKVESRLDDFDESLYILDGGNSSGNIFGIGGGLNGGVKYTNFPFGTLYFDAGLTIILLGGSTTANTLDFSTFFFDFNFGYRRDIGW